MSIQSKQQLALPPAPEPEKAKKKATAKKAAAKKAQAEMSPEEQQDAARAELIGDTARRAYDDAMRLPVGQRDLLLAQAQQASIARRSELQAQAKVEPRGWLANWMCNMPITPRQMMILARIYSYQVSDKPGKEFQLSISALGDDIGMRDRSNLIKHLHELVAAGYLLKYSNGNNQPYTYLLDVPRCLEAAMANGWEPVRQAATDSKETAQQDGEQHKQ